MKTFAKVLNMLGKVFDKILNEDEEQVLAEGKKVQKKVRQRWSLVEWLEFGGVILLILIPRLYYIFFISNPQFTGWYTDTFHHWQIAFLSKEIGFKQDFLRLWDFKGMEFFWGLLHPLVLVILFCLTGSISILVPKLMSVGFGVLAYGFLFLLIKRYFNRQTAWAAAVLTAFFPITLFSNTVGMQEELGLFFIFGGMLLWPEKPILTGLSWALASMVRAEYWLFAVGLAGALFFLKKHLDKAILLAIGYSVLIILYMKYLVNYTGSFIFPIKLNFLASVKGEWFENLPIVGEKLMAKRISQGIFGFGLTGGIWTLLKKPKQSILWLFGFANLVFIGFMVGFGSYVKGYIPRFWVDRLYNWPYLFTGILLISFLFYYLPKKIPIIGKIGLPWLLLIGGLIYSQKIWQVINYHMQPVAMIFNQEYKMAEQIDKAYQGGKVLLPEDRPYVTYFLATEFGLEGEKMVGQMFDPFYYFADENDLFSNWGKDRELVLNWLKKEDIKLIAIVGQKPRYDGLFKKEGQYFEKLPSKTVELYQVNLAAYKGD